MVTRHRFLAIKLCGLSLLLMNSSLVLATSYSNSSSVQVVTAQATLSGASDATGYVRFDEGFILPSNNTFTVDIVPAVYGQIDMNGTGTLSLSRDLSLGSDATIINSGSIAGNGNALFLSNDLSYDSGSAKTLTISENLIVDGQGHTLTIGSSNVIAIANAKTLTLKNMTLVLTSSSTAFTLGNGSSGLVLENVRVLFNSNYTFTTGTVTIKGLTTFASNLGDAKTFTYSSQGNFTIAATATLLLDHNMTFKHNYATTDNFIFTNRSSRLLMIGATFESAARTLKLQSGTLIADHRSYLKGSGSGNITLGDTSNRLYVIFLPAASLEVTGNTVTYANSN